MSINSPQMYIAILFGCNKITPKIYFGPSSKAIKKFLEKKYDIELDGYDLDEIPYEVSDIAFEYKISYQLDLTREEIKDKFSVCSCTPLLINVYKINDDKVIDVENNIKKKINLL